MSAHMNAHGNIYEGFGTFILSNLRVNKGLGTFISKCLGVCQLCKVRLFLKPACFLVLSRRRVQQWMNEPICGTWLKMCLFMDTGFRTLCLMLGRLTAATNEGSSIRFHRHDDHDAHHHKRRLQPHHLLRWTLAHQHLPPKTL